LVWKVKEESIKNEFKNKFSMFLILRRKNKKKLKKIFKKKVLKKN